MVINGTNAIAILSRIAVFPAPLRPIITFNFGLNLTCKFWNGLKFSIERESICIILYLLIYVLKLKYTLILKYILLNTRFLGNSIATIRVYSYSKFLLFFVFKKVGLYCITGYFLRQKK
jgi:hypothetical protein